jgi:hypothetical protein
MLRFGLEFSISQILDSFVFKYSAIIMSISQNFLRTCHIGNLVFLKRFGTSKYLISVGYCDFLWFTILLETLQAVYG